jgi:hypothetical protein
MKLLPIELHLMHLPIIVCLQPKPKKFLNEEASEFGLGQQRNEVESFLLSQITLEHDD